MTKQEWIIKNDNPGVYIGAYREGLAKGLEIAEGFSEWKEKHAWEFDYREQRRHNTHELLEIYLTENEKK